MTSKFGTFKPPRVQPDSYSLKPAEKVKVVYDKHVRRDYVSVPPPAAGASWIYQTTPAAGRRLRLNSITMHAEVPVAPMPIFYLTIGALVEGASTTSWFIVNGVAAAAPKDVWATGGIGMRDDRIETAGAVVCNFSLPAETWWTVPITVRVTPDTALPAGTLWDLILLDIESRRD